MGLRALKSAGISSGSPEPKDIQKPAEEGGSHPPQRQLRTPRGPRLQNATAVRQSPQVLRTEHYMSIATLGG